jgi:hypothetical protein
LGWLDCPFTVAVTSIVPQPGGVVAWHDVVERHETFEAKLFGLNANVVPPGDMEKPVPEMETDCPPLGGPWLGDMRVTDRAWTVVIESGAVAVSIGELESVTSTVKAGVPVVVGVPLIEPVVGARDSPVGSAPLEIDQV